MNKKKQRLVSRENLLKSWPEAEEIKKSSNYWKKTSISSKGHKWWVVNNSQVSFTLRLQRKKAFQQDSNRYFFRLLLYLDYQDIFKAIIKNLLSNIRLLIQQKPLWLKVNIQQLKKSIQWCQKFRFFHQQNKISIIALITLPIMIKKSRFLIIRTLKRKKIQKCEEQG